MYVRILSSQWRMALSGWHQNSAIDTISSDNFLPGIKRLRPIVRAAEKERRGESLSSIDFDKRYLVQRGMLWRTLEEWGKSIDVACNGPQVADSSRHASLEWFLIIQRSLLVACEIQSISPRGDKKKELLPQR